MFQIGVLSFTADSFWSSVTSLGRAVLEAYVTEEKQALIMFNKWYLFCVLPLKWSIARFIDCSWQNLDAVPVLGWERMSLKGQTLKKLEFQSLGTLNRTWSIWWRSKLSFHQSFLAVFFGVIIHKLQLVV